MYSLIPIIFTVVITLVLIIGLIVYAIHSVKKQKADEEQIKLMYQALDYRREQKVEDDHSKDNPIKKFIKKYNDTLMGADLITRDRPAKVFYRNIGIIAAVLFVLTFVYTQGSLVFSTFPVIAVYLGVYGWASNKVAKISSLMNDQIPAFVSTLKANIQSNQTPEQAIIAAVENTADPLYSELRIIKVMAETGPFDEAMDALRRKTNNDTIKFLCSCVQISAEVGANLEEQLVVIEEILSGRKEIERKLSKAEGENKPLLYVSFSIIPAVFALTYLTNAQTKAFWFNGLISWLLFFGIIFLLAGAWFLASRMIKKVRDM